MLTNRQNILMEPLGELDGVAEQLIQLSDKRRIWLFEGSLGAGKTTLIKHVCSRLGVQGAIQSPTFSLVNEYETEAGMPVFHFDLYRLKSLRELLEIGIEEYLDSGSYCFIEWPEIGRTLWPDDSFSLLLEQNAAGRRVVSLQADHQISPSIP